MSTDYELGEIVIHAVTGRHGRLIAFPATRAPMAEIRWKDLSVTRVPIDMIRKRDNLPIPVEQPTYRRGRRKRRVEAVRPVTGHPAKNGQRPWGGLQDSAERDRLAMKALYQQKSGDYSY